MNKKRVVVIGGGLSGLAATYDLVRAGCQVTLLEAAPEYGGLASSVKLGGVPVERFYHFICRTDAQLMKLVDELGLRSKLHWRTTRTSFYYNGKMWPFGSPVDLLRFSAVPWLERLRFGLHVAHSRYRSEWRRLDEMPAKAWLIECLGEEAYNVIWHPLLKVKFGDHHDKISAAWIWHRIWRVAASRRSLVERERFGCLEHGSATVVDALVEWLRRQPHADLRVSSPVKPLVLRDGAVAEVHVGEEIIPCDAVISTAALPALDKLVPDRPEQYFQRARKVEYIGVVCMLLSLKKPFGRSFWTNINDPRIVVNGVVEQSALNRNLQEAGLNVLYVPFYVPTTDARYRASDEELFEEYTAMLKLVNPQFDRDWVKEYHVFRAPYAQPIFTTNFVDLIPGHRTPVKGLYVTDSTQFYPEDRTISAAAEQGRKAAALLLEDLRAW
jgi:protoporphyrinogen oxidase